MRTFLTAAALLVGLAAAPAAQPVLTVSADPFDGSGEAPLVIRNVGPTAVSLDSLRIAPGAEAPVHRGIFASLTVTGSGPPRASGVDCGRYRTCRAGSTGTPRLAETLAVREALSIILGEYCALCRPADKTVGVDTLLLYHAGLPTPLRVRVSGYLLSVASEAGPPPGSLSVAVFPAPTSGRGTVRVTLAAPAARAEVSVVDALGRRVAVLHDGDLTAGPHDLGFDAAALVPGVYLVRVVTSAGRVAHRVTVAR